MSKQETELNSDETPGSNMGNWLDITVPTVTGGTETPWDPAPLHSCTRQRHFCPGTCHMLRHLHSFWQKAALIYTGCMLTMQFHWFQTNSLEIILRELKRLASLPLHNTERVLKSGSSLSSPSTAPTQQLLSFLAGNQIHLVFTPSPATAH